MKPALGVSLGLLVAVASRARSADDWIQQFPLSRPSPRVAHAMAYTGEGKVLLFAGCPASGWDDETWVYDLGAGTWEQRFPYPRPSVRSHHAMAYTGGDQVLLYGGMMMPGHDDIMWVYDLSADSWAQRSPSPNPSARYYSAMACVGGDEVLLFGGFPGPDDETWLYHVNAGTWEQQFPSPNPSARRGHAMAYIGEDQVLLFGGHDAYGYDDETWVYDLSAGTWTQQFPPSGPSPRWGHAMAHIGGDQVMLFGGWDGQNDDETWIYDLSADNWTMDTNTIQPSARHMHGICGTSADGSSYPVLFGGWRGCEDAETWTFGGGDYLLDVVQATIDMDPDVLNLNNQTRWITCYIEFPDQYAVEDVDTATVALTAIDGETIAPIYRHGPVGTGDYDGDGIPDLMVTFGTQELADALLGVMEPPAEVQLTVDGELTDGAIFEGNDLIWVIRFGASTRAHGRPSTSEAVVLQAASPNPPGSETQIRYVVPERARVTLRVYNLTGALVRTLVSEHKSAGTFRSQWNGKDAIGRKVASGVYYLRIEAGDRASVRTVVLKQ